VPVVGTSPEAIHLAEDRAAFARVLEKAGLTAPRYGTPPQPRTRSRSPGDRVPVLVRPSYVLGGARMEIVYDDARCGPTSPGPPKRVPATRC